MVIESYLKIESKSFLCLSNCTENKNQTYYQGFLYPKHLTLAYLSLSHTLFPLLSMCQPHMLAFFWKLEHTKEILSPGPLPILLPSPGMIILQAFERWSFHQSALNSLAPSSKRSFLTRGLKLSNPSSSFIPLCLTNLAYFLHRL